MPRLLLSKADDIRATFTLQVPAEQATEEDEDHRSEQATDEDEDHQSELNDDSPMELNVHRPKRALGGTDPNPDGMEGDRNLTPISDNRGMHDSGTSDSTAPFNLIRFPLLSRSTPLCRHLLHSVLTRSRPLIHPVQVHPWRR